MKADEMDGWIETREEEDDTEKRNLSSSSVRSYPSICICKKAEIIRGVYKQVFKSKINHTQDRQKSEGEAREATGVVLSFVLTYLHLISSSFITSCGVGGAL